jgi:putative inorganic carbon (hco3(-)) transporter
MSSIQAALLRVRPEAPALGLAAALAALGGLVYVTSAYAVHPLALPALLGAALFVVAAFMRPVFGLAGAVLMTPLDAFAFSLPVGALSPAEAALAVVALAWVSRAALEPQSVRLPSVRDAPLAVLVLVVAAGVLVAVDTSPVLRVTVLWSIFYLVFLQAQGLPAGEIRLVLIASAVAGGILGSIGVVNYLQSGSPELFAGGAVTGERAVGSFADPNYYAALLALASLPAIVLALANLRRDGWLLAPAALALTGLAFSLSRGAMLGLAVGLLFLLLWTRARRIALVVAGAAILLTLAGGNPLVRSEYYGAVSERISSLQNPTRESKRPEIWETALDITIEHSLVGIGVNQFEHEAVQRSLFERGRTLENAHSIPLSLAAETGVIGLAAFLVLVGQLVARSLRALVARDRLVRVLAFGVSAALVAFLVQGLTVTLIRVPVLTGMFFLLAGLLTGLADLSRRPETS